MIFTIRASRCFATVNRISVTLSSQIGLIIDDHKDVLSTEQDGDDDVRSFDKEFEGDDDAVPLSSSMGFVQDVTERLRG